MTKEPLADQVRGFFMYEWQLSGPLIAADGADVADF